MMNYGLFVLGAFALVASPGPDFFYVLTRALAHGRRTGVLSALGISCGLLVHTTLAALGLSALLQTSSVAFNLVKWTGAIYLVYIGLKSLREYSHDMAVLPPLRAATVVRQGFFTNVFNPKAALTFLAFLPQFVHAEYGNAQVQVIVLGLTLTFIATLWFSVVGIFAGSIGARLLRNHALWRRCNVLRAS